MFNTNAGTLPVSIPLNVGGNGNGGVFGSNGFDDIIALAVVAMIFGWNGNGYGGFGGYGGGQSTSLYEGYVLNNDFSQLSKQISDAYSMTERKLDIVNNGLCDGFYTNAQLINGVNMNIANAQTGITNAITTNGYENRLGQQAIGQQIANCCCDLKQLSGETNYNIATQANMIDRTVSDKFCQTNFNMQTNTRDIIDSQNAGFRMLSDKIDSVVNSQKDAKIAEQACIINNQYLLSQINKTAVPAYIVQNPNCGCNPTVYGTTIA